MKSTKLFLTTFKPGSLVYEDYTRAVEDGTTYESVLKNLVRPEEVSEASYDTLLLFNLVEKAWNGYKMVNGFRQELYETVIKSYPNCLIGEYYSKERVAQEFGTNSTFYGNIESNGYSGAVKHINGQFSPYREGEDIIYSQQEALDLIRQGERERSGSGLTGTQPGE